MITNLLMSDYQGQALCAAIKNDPDLADTRVLVLVAGEEDRAGHVDAVGVVEKDNSPGLGGAIWAEVKAFTDKPVSGFVAGENVH